VFCSNNKTSKITQLAKKFHVHIEMKLCKSATSTALKQRNDSSQN